MAKALVWLVFTYGALKPFAMFFARRPGFKRATMGFWDRLRAGEPVLFLAAFLMSVPLALLTSRYAERTVTSQYAHSADCYGRLVALRNTPLFRDRVDGSTLYLQIEAHQDAAFAMARELDIKPAEVSKALAGKTAFFSDRYATLRGEGLYSEIQTARRCLLPPGAEPNA